VLCGFHSDPSAAENSRRRQKSAAKYCGWSQSAVKLFYGGRRFF